MKDTAHRLRDNFDRTFGRPHAAADGGRTDLLGLSLRGDPHAIRLSDISYVTSNRVITPIPTRSIALLGIAGLRGAIVPVFDLGALVGYPRLPDPRWFAVVEREGSAVGLAFDTLLGLVRAPAGSSVKEVVEVEGQVWPLLEVAAMYERIDRS